MGNLQDDRTRPLLLAQAAKRGALDWRHEDAEQVIAILLSRLDAQPAVLAATLATLQAKLVEEQVRSDSYLEAMKALAARVKRQRLSTSRLQLAHDQATRHLHKLILEQAAGRAALALSKKDETNG